MSVLFNSMLLGSGVAASRPTFVASTVAVQNSSVSLTINKPSGAASGDFMIAIIWGINLAAASATGWTLAGSVFSGNVRLAVLTRTVDGSEGADFTFSLANSGAKLGTILLYRGGVGAIDVIGARTEANSATATAASLTATQAGTLIASFALNDNGESVFTPPAAMTQRSSYVADSSRPAMATYELTLPSSAGATSAATLVWTTAANNAGVQIQIY